MGELGKKIFTRTMSAGRYLNEFRGKARGGYTVRIIYLGPELDKWQFTDPVDRKHSYIIVGSRRPPRRHPDSANPDLRIPNATNGSRALWIKKDGWSMEELGVPVGKAPTL